MFVFDSFEENSNENYHIQVQIRGYPIDNQHVTWWLGSNLGKQ